MNSESARFKEARVKAGLTLESLASKIGYSLGTISSVENSHDKPSKRLRQSLIEALNINEEWLRTGKGPIFRVSPAISLYEWRARPNYKKWDALSDEEKN